MKPEWCDEKTWGDALLLCGDLTGAVPSWAVERCARALLTARQEGRKAGLEEAAKIAAEAGNTWSGTRDAEQACQEAAVDDKCEEIAAAIRSLEGK